MVLLKETQLGNNDSETKINTSVDANKYKAFDERIYNFSKII